MQRAWGFILRADKDKVGLEGRFRIGCRLVAISERVDFVRLGCFSRKRRRVAEIECRLKGQQQRRQVDGTISAVPPFIRLRIAKPTWGKRDRSCVASTGFRLEFIQPDGNTGPAREGTPLFFQDNAVVFSSRVFLWSPWATSFR